LAVGCPEVDRTFLFYIPRTPFDNSVEQLSSDAAANNGLGADKLTWTKAELVRCSCQRELEKISRGEYSSLDVKSIAHDVEYVTGYGIESNKGSRILADDIDLSEVGE
jgi:hypothetical protein